MPPLGQYFLASSKADESIAAPKGRGSRTPSPFPLQTGHFLGAAKGAMMRFGWTPLAGTPCRALRPELAASVLVGEGHAPVVAVLHASAKKQVDPSAEARDHLASND